MAEEAPNRAGDSPEICQNDKAKDEDPYPVQEQAYRHSALRNPVMITFHQIGGTLPRIAGDRAQAIRLKPNSDHRMVIGSRTPRTLDLWTMRRRPEVWRVTEMLRFGPEHPETLVAEFNLARELRGKRTV